MHAGGPLPSPHSVSCSVGGSGSGVRGYVVLGNCGTLVALSSISLAMSLLNVPFDRFPPVLSSPTCPTSQNPCASAHWSGMSGCFSNLTPKTGYEPNFVSYMNEKHTPTNLPDSHRISSAVTTPRSCQPKKIQGTSSSSKQTAACRVLHNVHVWIFR